METPVCHAVLAQGINGGVTAALDDRKNVEQEVQDIRKLLSMEMSLPRNLSSPSKGVRERALEVLGGWLPSCKQIEETDLTKIWQGILNCVWQTDKASVADLSRRVSFCLGSLKPGIAVATFKVLLSTMVREWSGIDRKRVEKFRNFFRDCLNQTLRVLQTHGWDRDHVTRFSEAFEDMDSASGGLNVLLAGIFMEELRVVTPASGDILQVLLEPFLRVFSASGDRVLAQKIRDAVFLPLLRHARDARTGEDGLGSLVLDLPLSERFLELAASSSHRKLLNQLHEDFDWTKPTTPLEDGKSQKRESKTKHRGRVDAASPDAGVRIFDEIPVDEKKADEPEQQQVELPVTRSKRKRVDANGPQFERRVLRSDHGNLEAQQVQPGDDPVVVNDECSTSGTVPSSPKLKRKRKNSESSTSGMEGSSDESDGPGSSKKVRFSLRNNIIWTPHRPLPPQWVRVPPCAAPRGSAMKAGVLPGPIQVTPPKKKSREKSKKKKSAKKVGGKKTKKQRRNSV